MADALERARWAVEDNLRELAEAEASGDHEAVLIWTRSLWEAKQEEADVMVSGFDMWEPEDGRWYR